MRILQISSAKSFGGGEKHLVDLINGLAERGHEIFLAAPKNSPLRELPIGIPSANFLPVMVRHALDLSAARQLARFIRERNIEIVHAHLARDYVPASLAVRFAFLRRNRVKLVLTRHVLFPMKRLHRLALSNVSRVIAVSRAVENNLRRCGIFSAEKIVTINNGIKVAHWAGGSPEELRRAFREQHGIPADSFLIGTVGELKKLKGQEDLILAAEIILRDLPTACFIFVGKDNSADGEYGKHLRNLASAIGAADKFIWLDRVEDTAPLLHALDVFVSASHSESFGLAILEAMASGCAVVATETAGACELLGSEDLVPVEDPVKLASKICKVLTEATERERLGKVLQIRARENFELEKMLDETERLYSSL